MRRILNSKYNLTTLIVGHANKCFYIFDNLFPLEILLKLQIKTFSFCYISFAI